MRILLAHNYYQQPGGEDRVFEDEARLLERHGHEVVRFVVQNDAVEAMGKAQLVRATLWNPETHDRIGALVRKHRVQVAHFHNTFPLMSPSGYRAARQAGAAVVQTLHNFRLLCLNAVLYREGHVCEDCLDRPLKWPGVLHRCYRESVAGSGVVAAMLGIHRFLRTWEREVDFFIAPSQSAARTLGAAGLPTRNLLVKPHFVDPDPGEGAGRGGYALFVGRLSHEKGIATLLNAWRDGERLPPLRIIGDGPLAPAVREAANRKGIQWLGRLSPDEVNRAMGDAAVVILPSECYETFARVAAEAFAAGTPVIASNHGAMAEIVEHGGTGLLFRPGDAVALSAQVRELMSAPNHVAAMRRACRQEYLSKYTGQRNYELLMSIYDRAMGMRGAA